MLRLSTCSNRSFSDETVKNFSRVSCRFGQSSNICLTVSGSLQDYITSLKGNEDYYELAADKISQTKSGMCEWIQTNEALTLNHHPGPAPHGVFVKENIYCRRWRQVQYLADVFWRRWLREYLPTLREKQKWHKTDRNLQAHDADYAVPRKHTDARQSWWSLPGQDGHVLRTRLKTAKSTFIRPIDKLWPHSIGISSGQPATNYQPAPNGTRLGGSWVTRRRPKSAGIESLGEYWVRLIR